MTMLALLKSNTVAKYPIGLQDLQQAYPDTSFTLPLIASDLVDFGVVDVHPTDQPAVDPRTQRVEEAAPALINGEWQQQWAVVALSAEEQKQIVDSEADRVRAQRNQKLTACDWTQLPDAAVDHAAWAEYRKQLRDVPNQSGFPWDVQWPDTPVRKQDSGSEKNRNLSLR